MQGFIMKFPIIKVKDSAGGYIHIVGTNSHDTLYIDKNADSIQYRNLQNSDGTGINGSYEFVEEGNEYSPYAEVEFVSFDELLEIYKEQVNMSAECEKKHREMLKQFLEKYDKELEESRNEGIFHT